MKGQSLPKIILPVIFVLATSMLPSFSYGDDLEDARLAIRTKQFTTAAEILTRSAATGDAEAQYQLATLYRSGFGVEKSHEQAAMLLQSASAQGHVKAQYNLAVMVEKGWGTEKNKKLAIEWYTKAAAQGHKLAKTRLRTIQNKDSTNTSSLHVIVRQGDIEALQKSLKRKNLDILDPQGRNALFTAIEYNQYAAAELLIKAGINLEKIDDHGDTALLFSCRSKNKSQFSRTLITNGANLNARDTGGNTALHIAAGKGGTKMVRFMLSNGANLKALNLAGQSATDIARRRENKQVLLVLNDQHGTKDKGVNKKSARKYATDVNQSGIYRDWPALNTAAWQGNKGYLIFLLNEGPETDQLDPGSYTALARATLQKEEEIIKILLNHGADPTAGPSPENTAALIAARTGQTKMLAQMLDRKTPAIELLNLVLISVSTVADNVLVNKILTAGAEINAIDEDSKTALIRAAAKGNILATQQLINSQAEIDSLDRQKRTALGHAIINQHVKTVSALLAAGASLSIMDDAGLLPIHLAAKSGSVAILELLLTAGADANARSSTGNTPLMVAAHNGNVGTAELLLSKNIDSNAKNHLKNTALMLAAAAGRNEIVSVLLKHGVKTGIKNNKRETAKDMALSHKNIDIADILSSHEKENKWTLSF